MLYGITGVTMCGRFTLTAADVGELARALAAELDRIRAESYRPRYNVAPGSDSWVVRLEGGRRRLLPARFGLAPAGRPALVNARAETAARLPTFRTAFRDGRCLVPTDGFFEWTGPPGDRRPLWFRPRDGGLLLLAGLVLDRVQARDGGPAFVILTTEANAAVALAHDRMPAILSGETAQLWLERPDPALLRPAPPDTLVATAVSPRVNSVAHDDPACIEPARPPVQGSLF